MDKEPIQVDLDENEKDLISVVLSHIAEEEKNNDPEAAQEFKEIAKLVKAEEPLQELDWQTVWIVLGEKQTIEFPSQSYDENKVSESAMEKIQVKVPGLE